MQIINDSKIIRMDLQVDTRYGGEVSLSITREMPTLDRRGVGHQSYGYQTYYGRTVRGMRAIQRAANVWTTRVMAQRKRVTVVVTVPEILDSKVESLVDAVFKVCPQGASVATDTQDIVIITKPR